MAEELVGMAEAQACMVAAGVGMAEVPVCMAAGQADVVEACRHSHHQEWEWR